MTTDPTEKKSSGTMLMNGACLVLVVVGFALVSNRLLDKAGLVNDPALTIDERKEKAARNQERWEQSSRQDRRSSTSASKMCDDANILATAKKLINDQTPNIGELSDVLQKLDASRGSGIRDPLAEKEKLLRETKEYYARNPVDPNDHSMGDQNAERAKRLATLEGEIAELRAKIEPARRRQEQIRNMTNEIIVTAGPAPVEFDPASNRAACKLTYTVKGFGYDNVGVRLGAPDTAVYTIQQADDDWIVNLVSLN